tara:strand:+ start:910 stop:1692 length:783 start_codon:yes stop_codon:yes gene_type:complete
MSDWFEVVKEDYFQDYRTDFKVGDKAPSNIELILEAIEKVLAEEGDNPKFEWFAKQPFYSKVMLELSRRLNENISATQQRTPWTHIHNILVNDFNMRIDGANENNCGETGRLGKYGGLCGGSISGGEGSALIIYMPGAKIFGKVKPEEPESKTISRPGKTITSGGITIKDSGDWKENLRRIKTAKRKRRITPQRLSRRSKRGGTSGYGGAIIGSRPFHDNYPGPRRGRPGRCDICLQLKAKRNLTKDGDKVICDYCKKRM